MRTNRYGPITVCVIFGNSIGTATDILCTDVEKTEQPFTGHEREKNYKLKNHLQNQNPVYTSTCVLI